MAASPPNVTGKRANKVRSLLTSRRTSLSCRTIFVFPARSQLVSLGHVSRAGPVARYGTRLALPLNPGGRAEVIDVGFGDALAKKGDVSPCHRGNVLPVCQSGAATS